MLISLLHTHLPSWLALLADYPVLSSFLIGLLVALDPCTLGLTLTAIGYLAKDLQGGRKVFLRGLVYAAGRLVTYFLLAILLLYALSSSRAIGNVQTFLSHQGGFIFCPLFILIGILLIWQPRVPRWHSSLPSWAQTRIGKGWLGSFLLGLLFALAFCPATALLFFGGLLPLAGISNLGLYSVLIFGIGSALPAVLLAWVLAFSLNRLPKLYHQLEKTQRWMNLAVAILLICTGVYYLLHTILAA